MRIPFMPREKAAVVILRRKFGYPINLLAKFTGRSTSVIHRILKRNATIGNIRLNDYRKLPGHVKKIGHWRMQRQLAFWMEKWMPFLLGESERPP